MPAIVVAFLVNALRLMLMAQAGRIILGILGFFGLQFAVQKFAVGPAMNQISGMLQNGASGEFASTLLAWVGVLKFDVAISMLISAVTMRFAITAGKAFLSKV